LRNLIFFLSFFFFSCSN